SPEPSKAAQLRAMLTSPELEFIMEAHDGISAKIVEEAGFKGIWASGLSVSAALGVRDNNEASWTQVLEVLEFMSDATTIPILVDGDTGYGNFNNMRRVVRKLCQRDVAGICIEDKLFPKTNSFIGDGQPLADIDEFCGKIKAGKDSQTDADFSIVARIEALISGWGLDEALKRAEAYCNAGADALLIHSKQSTADEILAFKKEWGDRLPVVIVPTIYYATPTSEFRDAGMSLVIWANHNLRASITAMRETSSRIHREESLVGIEGNVISVKDIFELTGNAELAEAEKRYLPSPRDEVRAVILAASRGEELGTLTEDRPKCMIDVRGQPLLRRLVSTFTEGGVRNVTVVRGYKKEMINLPSVKTIDNDVHATTGEAGSLACARDVIKGPCLIAYGDILFRQYILDQVLETEDDIVLAADALWRERESSGAENWVRDLVSCSTPFSTGYLDDQAVRLTGIGPDLADDAVSGEWIGLLKLSAKGSETVKGVLESMRADGTLQKASMIDLINRILKEGNTVSVVYVTGHWLDVDNAFDLAKAREFL
ncbi:MAG: phosphoenolpyruvate mutase, partial [Rhodospirillales bacterium]|nr:phosphoenolpyruvate mutase [Rhodospirillales bacterium]